LVCDPFCMPPKKKIKSYPTYSQNQKKKKKKKKRERKKERLLTALVPNEIKSA